MITNTPLQTSSNPTHARSSAFTRSPRPPASPFHSRPKRGAAFIITIWILAALAGLALALGHVAGVQALASADRASEAQANAAVKGGEQFALSAVDNEILTPGNTTADANIQNLMGTSDPHSGMLVGNCRVWIIKPDPDDETALAFGLTDEGGKLDINYAAEAQLLLLPNITQENVDCIIDWRDADSTPSPQGAEDTYYAGLPDPYLCKNANFETVEELNLVKSIALDDSNNPTDLLFGQDRTHCGRVDSDGSGAGGVDTGGLLSGTVGGTSTSDRGIYPFITVYGMQASTVPPASATSTTTKIADVNSADQSNLRAVLTQYLKGGNANLILQQTAARISPPRRGGGGNTSAASNRFTSIFDWAVAVNLTSAQFSSIIHYVKASPAGTSLGGTSVNAAAAPVTPLININTAPLQVLECLTSLTPTDAQAIVTYLQANTNAADPSDISWVLDVIPRAKLSVMGKYITGMSYCYSADIVAATLDGRAFKRVRIVIDASSGTSKIIYRRDLTSLGWPLPTEFRPVPGDVNNQ